MFLGSGCFWRRGKGESGVLGSGGVFFWRGCSRVFWEEEGGDGFRVCFRRGVFRESVLGEEGVFLGGRNCVFWGRRCFREEGSGRGGVREGGERLGERRWWVSGGF